MCELQLFFAGIGQALYYWKALDLGSLNMQFQQDWPKDKKITALLIFCLTTSKTLQPSEVVETALHHASIGVRCELV